MTEPVIVIGGGLAGLTAAASLARAGERVLLLERARALGGLAATRREQEAALNLGPHALYRGGAGAAVLERLGVSWSGGRPDGSGLAVQAGRLHRLPSGLTSLLGTGLLGLRGKWELARFLGRIPALDPRPLARISARAWIEAELRDPVARATALAVVRVTTYMDAAERLSADAALGQLQLALGAGVAYLDDGWGTLVDGLAGAARAAGATLRTRAPVRALGPRGDGGWWVQTGEGEPLAARALILAVAPGAARALLPADAAAAIDARAEPVRAACLDLVLRGLSAPARTFALGIDRPLYWSVHTATARLAAPGLEVAHAMKYCSPAASADDDLAELEALVDRLQPGWRERVVLRRFLPRLTVASAAPSPATGGLVGRPGPELPGLPGLWLAGDWVGPTGLLADASLASGEAAARRALARVAAPAATGARE